MPAESDDGEYFQFTIKMEGSGFDPWGSETFRLINRKSVIGCQAGHDGDPGHDRMMLVVAFGGNRQVVIEEPQGNRAVVLEWGFIPPGSSHRQMAFGNWDRAGRFLIISDSINWGPIEPGEEMYAGAIAVLLAQAAVLGLIPLAIVWLFVGFVGVLSVRVRNRYRWTHCPNCGYDLRGLREFGCPECGWNRE